MTEPESYPLSRPRRLRQSEALRRLVRETRLTLDQLVMPYFVKSGRNVREEIPSMPGQFRFSPDSLVSELEELSQAGVKSVLLFGLPESKDEKASSAWAQDGIVQKTVREIKKNFKELLVITDVCLCAYMNHGHCGVLNAQGEIENDPSLKILAQAALSHAEAGADIVAPSDMMDGRVRAIRETLDGKGFQNTAIMSYAAKYASAFYGPFRDAAHSAPASGDRKTYQMDPANRKEALREMALDIQEGADILMVKPALAYLDVIREAASAFRHPVAAYAVSGEYAMIKAASEKGVLDEKKAVAETFTSLARAGAQILISYHAKQFALWSQEDPNILQVSLSQ
jgi:porphobilinogen synthase